MDISWDEMMDVLLLYGLKTGFLITFKETANNKKVTLCMENKYISRALIGWLNSPGFNDSLKNSVKSKETRMEANEKFKKNEHLKLCCKLYTQAAQLAPSKSLELALALSNRSAVYFRLKEFQDCVKDIDSSLNILENSDTDFKKMEINKGQLIVKLLKRKIECLIALNQYEKAQVWWDKLLELSKNTYNITIENQFVKKCQILSDCPKNNTVETDTVKIVSKITQHTSLTEDLIKKTLEENKITLPFKSPKLELCYTEAKGKHFIASTEIKYGELLIFENPFAFVLLPEYYDSFCYNCCVVLKHYSIPCDGCCSVLFCSEKCRQESWNLYHCWECKWGTSILKRIGIAHLALRLTLETSNSNNENDQIYNLLTHIDDIKMKEMYQYCLTATLLVFYLQKKTAFFFKYSKNPSHVGNELLHHMTRLVCNGNAISTHMLSNDGSKTSTLLDESQPRIGTAIFPTSSLLNHSCDPNIFSSNLLKYVVIKASRDIKKGEEVTNCYGPNFRRMPFAERQSSLKAQYHFDCKCCVCVDPSKDDLFFSIYNGLVCLSCKQEIKATLSDLNTSDIVQCCWCSEQFSSMKYNDGLLQADEIYNRGIEELKRSNVSKAINYICESLSMYSLFLNQKNSKFSKCEDDLAKCFAAIGDFKNCLMYLDRSLKKIEDRYGIHSLEVAYELDKISDIMVNNIDIRQNRNLIQQALAYVHRSKEIFHANLSVWDIPYNEFDKANAEYKEKVLLQLLENRLNDVNFENLKI